MQKKKSKLIPLSRLRVNTKETDSMSTLKREYSDERARGFAVLMEAQRYYDNMFDFRAERTRNKNYCYGKQWNDMVDVDGERMTEEEYIKRQGSIPLKTNLIRRLVKSVLGVYRQQQKEPVCTARDREEQKLGETMSTVLQCNWQLNRMNEVQARTMEEFLISGFVAQRKWYGWRNNRLDCWTDYVQPNNFFIDCNMRDFRGWDVSCVGEIHDISFNQVCEQFAHTPQDYGRLKNIYADAMNKNNLVSIYNQFGYEPPRNYSFLYCTDTSRCRVIEVWRKESKPRWRCHDYLNGDIYKVDVEDYNQDVVAENLNRLEQGRAAGMADDDIPMIEAEWFMDDYWYYYFLSPFGDILDEGETPYEHKSHPYVFKAYPFIDGEIHSFVNDVIDQQRYANRLITLYDWIMRSSAKGVLMFPEDCLPDDMTIEDIADEWTRFNGMIVIKKGAQNLPQQVSANVTNIGIGELLNMQLKFFEEISGVQGALQGKPGYSGTSYALYSQQTQNATTNLLDLLETFSNFTVDAAYKDVKNMQQFYDTKRVVNIAGKGGAQIIYDPQKIRDTEFDLSITESTSSAAYRQLANDFLMQIWQSQQISLEQLLEFGNFPFADELLQSIRSQKEQMEKGNVPDNISPELLKQVQEQGNMNAVNKAEEQIRQ